MSGSVELFPLLFASAGNYIHAVSVYSLAFTQTSAE